MKTCVFMALKRNWHASKNQASNTASPFPVLREYASIIWARDQETWPFSRPVETGSPVQ